MFSPINTIFGKKNFSRKLCLCSIFLLKGSIAVSQVIDSTQKNSSPTVPVTIDANQPAEKKKAHWFDKISLRGYVQIRYNRLLETNSNLKLPYDVSTGNNGGFLIRRARMVFSGNVHERVYIYIQPDLASTPTGSSLIHFAQIRDAYFDLSLNKAKTYRFRVGQSKVPYGFENMQSSQNRLTLDRNDALNTALPNERDLGVFFYWAPAKIRELFTELTSKGLKGSGDYGVFGLGIYNGQTANRPDANNNQHIVTRLSYPFILKNGQIIEPGIQAYTGKYQVTPDQLSSPAIKGGNFADKRVAGTFVIYPQPFGLQTEYNIGKSPQFDPATQTIQVKSLKGGYALAMYRLIVKNHTLIPFIKSQYYEGGRKAELDARYGKVYETEIGVEWQPIPAFELVTQYTLSDRTTSDGKAINNQVTGNLMRIQAQFNF